MRKPFLSLLAVAISTQAGTIVDTSPPNANATDIVDSRLADAFLLNSAADVNGINFWYQAQFQTDLSDVAFSFYNNAGGALGSLIDSGVAVPATSDDIANNAFLASIAIPDLALSTGTYWLELHAGSTLTDTTGFTVWWAATDASGTWPALFNQNTGLPGTPLTDAGFDQYAFQLSGSGGGGVSPIPEPSTALLTGCALAGLLRLTLRARRNYFPID
jgi:hypothetical protein